MDQITYYKRTRVFKCHLTSFQKAQTSYSLHSASQCHSRGALAMTRCGATPVTLRNPASMDSAPTPFSSSSACPSCQLPQSIRQGVPDSTSKSYPSLSMHAYLPPKRKRDQVSWGTSLLLSYPATRNSVTTLCIMRFSLSTRHSLGLLGRESQ